MSLAVVQCPACLGSSRVTPDAIGQMVACPRCQSPFVAAEEVPVVHPLPRRPAAAIPVAPPRRLRPPEAEPVEAESIGLPGESKVPDPEHDPHRPLPAGLPVSVLVGLALLPFGIPLLWWATPVVTGQAATLSLAVPLSLAFSASTLCLGVVYTIDWTGTTRVKGVLMLVGLAYLSAAGLYFLKQDMMARVRGAFGAGQSWREVHSHDGRFAVRMPEPAVQAQEQPLPKVEMAGGYRATYRTANDGVYQYLVTAGTPAKPQPKPDEAWYDAVGTQLKALGTVTNEEAVATVVGDRGRQWTVQLNGADVRIVQVYVVEGRIYYLSVEGPNIHPGDEELVGAFFRSFKIENAKR